MYDVNEEKSFDNLVSHKEDFILNGNVKTPETFPFFVVGNKIDEENKRVVSTKRAQSWCEKNGNIPLFEISSKSGVNIDTFFETVTKTIINPPSRDPTNDSIDKDAQKKSEPIQDELYFFENITQQNKFFKF